MSLSKCDKTSLTIGLCNGLATCTNVDQIRWRHMASLGRNEFNNCDPPWWVTLRQSVFEKFPLRQSRDIRVCLVDSSPWIVPHLKILPNNSVYIFQIISVYSCTLRWGTPHTQWPCSLCHHDGCRCLGAKWVPYHHQSPCWTHAWLRWQRQMGHLILIHAYHIAANKETVFERGVVGKLLISLSVLVGCL